MIKAILTISVLLITLPALAQVKLNVNATGKHERAINSAKSAKQQAIQAKEKSDAKRAEAEQVLERIKAEKNYHAKYDSLKEIYTDTSSLNLPEMPEFTKPVFTKEDSLAIAEKILSQEDLAEYHALISDALQQEIPEVENADSIALVKAQAVLEEHAQSFLPAELNQNANPLESFQNPLEGGMPDLSGGVPEVSKPTRPNPNLIKPEQAQELFSKIDPEQFQGIQDDIKGLKEKYSSLPDARFPEEGVKRNSLQDVPFKKRLYFGGNFSIQSTDPVIIDSNPQVGYWINKKWLSGAGIVIREQFGKRDSLQSLTGDAHGFNVFTRFDIKKGFFGRAELESQVSKSLFSENENTESSWQNAYLIGLGREFRVGPVRMTSMISYDFNYKNNTLNARPIVFKIGFELSKKPE